MMIGERRHIRRKNLVASLVFFPAVLIVFGAVVLSAKQVEPLHQQQGTTSRIEVRVQILQRLNERWEFELSAHNSGSEPVFIMTAPMRSNGSKGGYFALDPQDPSILDISVRLYPPPDYCIYSNQTQVVLKQLDPGSTHVERITLAFPAKETSPPYKGVEFETFDRARIRAVRAAVGLLPNDEGIRDFLRRKQARGIEPNAGGLELIQKGPHQGKSLYEVQEIVWTPTLSF
jgi:hypothetical protein